MRALLIATALFGLVLGVGNGKTAEAKPDRVSICHYDTTTNQYAYITISERGLRGHRHHEKDVFDISKDDCLALNVKV